MVDVVMVSKEDAQVQDRRSHQKGIGTGCKDSNFPSALLLERYLRPGRTADPVPCMDLMPFRPIQGLQIVEKAVRVGGDTSSTASAVVPPVPPPNSSSVDDLLIGQNSTEPGTN